MHNHTTDAVLDHILDLVVQGEYDKAIVAIVRTKQALRVEAEYERSIANAIEAEAVGSDLPTVRPVKSARILAKEVTCPTCKAKPNKQCFRMSARGKNGEPTTDVLAHGKFHVQRRKAAKEARNG